MSQRNTRKSASQDWSVGATVRVGFLSLTIAGKLQNGDWHLTNIKGEKHYRFTPHLGLLAIDKPAA